MLLPVFGPYRRILLSKNGAKPYLDGDLRVYRGVSNPVNMWVMNEYEPFRQ